MKKYRLAKWKICFNHWLEVQCDRLSHRQQTIIVFAFLIIFGISSCYMVIHSIYSMGYKQGEQLVIEHIRELEILPKDSINQIQTKYGNR
ncbi:MAG: DUF3989 domain-containing protein [Bacteroidia bacterium]|nr:DUF3989 domain-containing protein [Bacteroidia bacterium]